MTTGTRRIGAFRKRRRWRPDWPLDVLRSTGKHDRTPPAQTGVLLGQKGAFGPSAVPDAVEGVLLPAAGTGLPQGSGGVLVPSRRRHVLV